jgi:predicted glycosyltransferase
MIYLSIDVGIKNLSFVLVSFDETKCSCTDRDIIDDNKSLGDLIARECIKILDWESIDLIEYNNANSRKNHTIESLVTFTLQFLSSFSTIEPDIVLVESQPCGFRIRNTKTKILSHVIQSFYFMKKIQCHFVSPKLKMSLCEDIPPKIRGKNRYQATKKAAVNSCRKMIHQPEFLDRYESIQKKDDMADSLLQSISYITRDMQKKLKKKHKRPRKRKISK